MELKEEQKHKFLDDIGEVEKKHGLELCAILHRVETQLKSSVEASLAIREKQNGESKP